MSRIDMYKDFSQKDKIQYFWHGDVFIKDDVSEEVYLEFKKIKNEYSPYLKYESLHGWYMPSLTPKGGFYKYYIPEDIFKYVFFKDGKIEEKENLPEELKDKFLVCKRIMEVDFAFLGKCMFIGGKKIGLKSSWKIGNSIVMIKQSTIDKISFGLNYKDLLDTDYIKNFDKYETEKKYYLQNGYKE